MCRSAIRNSMLLLVTTGIIALLGCSDQKTVNKGMVTEYPKPNVIPSAAERALFGANEFELLALDPMESAAGEFHRFVVLGRKTISDPEAKARVLKALKECMPELNDGEQKACFEPRHGIRVRGVETTFDFVVCFECSIVDVFANDQDIGGFIISREGDPQAVFDKEFMRPSGQAGGSVESANQ